jgi:hypothetical protein
MKAYAPAPAHAQAANKVHTGIHPCASLLEVQLHAEVLFEVLVVAGNNSVIA